MLKGMMVDLIFMGLHHPAIEPRLFIINRVIVPALGRHRSFSRPLFSSKYILLSTFFWSWLYLHVLFLLFWLGSVADHRPHTPTTTPFQHGKVWPFNQVLLLPLWSPIPTESVICQNAARTHLSFRVSLLARDIWRSFKEFMRPTRRWMVPILFFILHSMLSFAISLICARSLISFSQASCGVALSHCSQWYVRKSKAHISFPTNLGEPSRRAAKILSRLLYLHLGVHKALIRGANCIRHWKGQ